MKNSKFCKKEFELRVIFQLKVTLSLILDPTLIIIEFLEKTTTIIEFLEKITTNDLLNILIINILIITLLIILLTRFNR
jgi:hypothetical protein